MGRRKISIAPISDDRNRQVTFLKRKNGLFKKAYELGVLCSADVAVVVFNANGKLFEFGSGDLDSILLRYSHYAGPPHEKKGPQDYANKQDLLLAAANAASAVSAHSSQRGTSASRGGNHDDDDDDDDDDEDGLLGEVDEMGVDQDGTESIISTNSSTAAAAAMNTTKGKGKQALVAANARQQRQTSITTQQQQTQQFSSPATFPPSSPHSRSDSHPPNTTGTSQSEQSLPSTSSSTSFNSSFSQQQQQAPYPLPQDPNRNQSSNQNQYPFAPLSSSSHPTSGPPSMASFYPAYPPPPPNPIELFQLNGLFPPPPMSGSSGHYPNHHQGNMFGPSGMFGSYPSDQANSTGNSAVGTGGPGGGVGSALPIGMGMGMPNPFGNFASGFPPPPATPSQGGSTSSPSLSGSSDKNNSHSHSNGEHDGGNGGGGGGAGPSSAALNYFNTGMGMGMSMTMPPMGMSMGMGMPMGGLTSLGGGGMMFPNFYQGSQQLQNGAVAAGRGDITQAEQGVTAASANDSGGRGGGVPNWFGAQNPMMAAAAALYQQSQTTVQQHHQHQHQHQNNPPSHASPAQTAANLERPLTAGSNRSSPHRQDSVNSTHSPSGATGANTGAKPRLNIAIPTSTSTSLEQNRKIGLVTAGGASILGKGFSRGGNVNRNEANTGGHGKDTSENRSTEDNDEEDEDSQPTAVPKSAFASDLLAAQSPFYPHQSTSRDYTNPPPSSHAMPQFGQWPQHGYMNGGGGGGPPSHSSFKPAPMLGESEAPDLIRGSPEQMGEDDRDEQDRDQGEDTVERRLKRGSIDLEEGIEGLGMEETEGTSESGSGIKKRRA